MISAWTYEDVHLSSPNRRHILSVVRLMEVAMGAPTSGELFVDDSLIGGGFGPSTVWSNDSKCFAIPRWHGSQQKLCIYYVGRGELVTSQASYRVLELEVLKNGILTGVDSPIHQTQNLAVNIKSKF